MLFAVAVFLLSVTTTTTRASKPENNKHATSLQPSRTTCNNDTFIPTLWLQETKLLSPITVADADSRVDKLQQRVGELDLLQHEFWGFGRATTGPDTSWANGPLPGNDECVFFCSGSFWYDYAALILMGVAPMLAQPPAAVPATVVSSRAPPAPARVIIPKVDVVPAYAAPPFTPPTVQNVTEEEPAPTPPPCECSAVKECNDKGGGMWGFGDNSFGQLGRIDRQPAFDPIEIEPMQSRSVIAFSSFWEHAIAVSECGEKGKVVCRWGKHNFHRLGSKRCFQSGGEPQQLEDLMQDNSRQVSMVAAGRAHTLALVEDENGKGVFGWGSNNVGQLGNNLTLRSETGIDFVVPAWVTPMGPPTSHFEPLRLALLDDVAGDIISLKSGPDFSAALLGDGTLYMWGRNNYGQCGQGHFSTVNTPQVVTGGPWKEVSLGFDFVLALDKSGGVWVWGDNGRGQLGLGIEYATSPKPRKMENLLGVSIDHVAAGFFHGFAYGGSGIVGFGENIHGQLGAGDTVLHSFPVLVPEFADSPVAELSAGRDHSAAILKDGRVFTWGSNEVGQLAVSAAGCAPAPQHVPALDGNGLAHITCSYDSTYVW